MWISERRHRNDITRLSRPSHSAFSLLTMAAESSSSSSSSSSNYSSAAETPPPAARGFKGSSEGEVLAPALLLPDSNEEEALIDKSLPRELLLRVFSFLDVISRCRAAQVSRCVATEALRLSLLLTLSHLTTAEPGTSWRSMAPTGSSSISLSSNGTSTLH